MTFQNVAARILAGLLILGSGPAGAAETAQGLIIRNGLYQPVRLEISRDRFSTISDKSNIDARWQTTLQKVKLETSSDPSPFEVRVLEQAAGPKAQEMTRCQATTAEASSQMAVIIYKDAESAHCAIVDLNAFQPTTAASPRVDPPASNVALKS